jgi:hypothetical protein
VGVTVPAGRPAGDLVAEFYGLKAAHHADHNFQVVKEQSRSANDGRKKGDL